MERKKVAVLFGGQSSEHLVSCMSARNVINNIDKEKYEVILIGITEEGQWILTEDADAIADDKWKKGTVQAILSPDAGDHGILKIERGQVERIRVDLVFPVLHGLNGEDGTIQGLLELSKIPYVGCGVLSSAVAMDKLYTKIVVDTLGIRQADYIAVYREDMIGKEAVIRRVEDKFAYPVFIKPANAGSSKGVSKAENAAQLIAGLQEALRHDGKVLIEEMIKGREIECAVFGGGKEPVRSSGVGEILAAADFYDFEAKYFNPESMTVVNPDLPAGVKETVKDYAEQIFKVVSGFGLARVDFFVKENGEVVFNEINTMPGFTAISMYPMLWETQGIVKKELVSMLLEHAFTRTS